METPSNNPRENYECDVEKMFGKDRIVVQSLSIHPLQCNTLIVFV